MTRPCLVANWKMNLTPHESVALAGTIARRVPPNVDTVICPSFVALEDVARALSGSLVALGAQDVHEESAGAFTGSVSVSMIKDAGCQYVIVGHSERRLQYGETDVSIQKKITLALSAGITPILCVGETAAEREAGKAAEVVTRQVTTALHGLTGSASLLIAYEPVWAIGTGTPANAEDAARMVEHIRSVVTSSGPVRVLYGGSVIKDNVVGFVGPQKFDGVLVGGASLDADSFIAISEAVAAQYVV